MKDEIPDVRIRSKVSSRTTSVRLPEATLRALKLEAKRRNATVSNLLVVAATEWLKRASG